MKRFLIMFMVLGLLAGSVATAEAKKKKSSPVERTIEERYGVVPYPLTECERGSLTCMAVEARPTEAFFTAKVTDAHGQPVFVQVNGGAEGTFCGETTRPMSFEPGSRLEFLIEPMLYFWSNWGLDWVGPLDCPYRASSTGTISVTLSNLP